LRLEGSRRTFTRKRRRSQYPSYNLGGSTYATLSETSLSLNLSPARTCAREKLADNAKVIEDLKRQLSGQVAIVNSLKSAQTVSVHAPQQGQQAAQTNEEAESREASLKDTAIICGDARREERLESPIGSLYK
jgi:hypothetical protein